MLNQQEIETLRIAYVLQQGLDEGTTEEKDKYFLPVAYLAKEDAEKYKDGPHKITPLDIDETIETIQAAIKDDVADYQALKAATSHQPPTTTKLTQLRTQQDNTPLSEDAQKILRDEEYTATLNSLVAAKEKYKTALQKLNTESDTPAAKAYEKKLRKNIDSISSHVRTIAQAQEKLKQEINAAQAKKQSWQSNVNRTLTSTAPEAKSLAKEIGEEQARAILLTTTYMEKLTTLATINTALSNAKNANDPDIKEVVELAMDDLSKMASPEKTVKSEHGNRITTQSLETTVTEIIKNLEFDPQKHSAFQGEKIPSELNKLKTITETVYGAQQNILALTKELNQPCLTAAQEGQIEKKISEEQQKLQSKVSELNTWLLKHEYGLLRCIDQEIANKLLKANHELMDHVGYHETTQRTRWQTFREGKEYANRPHTTISEKYDSKDFVKKYGPVKAGAYGDIVKFYHPETDDKTELDVSQLILPLYGANSSDPQAEKFSLLQLLIDTYGPVGSQRFNNHATLEKDGSITIKWKGSADKEKLFNAIKTRNDDYVKWKDGLEATANSGQDVTASIKHDEDQHVQASLRRP